MKKRSLNSFDILKKILSIIIPSLLILLFIFIDSKQPYYSKYIILNLYILFPLIYVIQGIMGKNSPKTLIIGMILPATILITTTKFLYPDLNMLLPIIIYTFLGFIVAFLLKNITYKTIITKAFIIFMPAILLLVIYIKFFNGEHNNYLLLGKYVLFPSIYIIQGIISYIFQGNPKKNSLITLIIGMLVSYLVINFCYSATISIDGIDNTKIPLVTYSLIGIASFYLSKYISKILKNKKIPV